MRSLMRCGIFTRRIFACAQLNGCLLLALNAFGCCQLWLTGPSLLRLLTAIVCCICSTYVCLPLAKYQHPRKHARCAHHAGINGCGLVILTSREVDVVVARQQQAMCCRAQRGRNMMEGKSDSETGSWLLSLEFSFSLNSFSLGLWFCSEYFVVPTTGSVDTKVGHSFTEQYDPGLFPNAGTAQPKASCF